VSLSLQCPSPPLMHTQTRRDNVNKSVTTTLSIDTSTALAKGKIWSYRFLSSSPFICTHVHTHKQTYTHSHANVDTHVYTLYHVHIRMYTRTPIPTVSNYEMTQQCPFACLTSDFKSTSSGNLLYAREEAKRRDEGGVEEGEREGERKKASERERERDCKAVEGLACE